MFSSSKITTQGRLYSQTEIDHLFNSTIVLPNIIYGLSVYGAADSELTTILRFLDRCHKHRYINFETCGSTQSMEIQDKKIIKNV